MPALYWTSCTSRKRSVSHPTCSPTAPATQASKSYKPCSRPRGTRRLVDRVNTTVRRGPLVFIAFRVVPGRTATGHAREAFSTPSWGTTHQPVPPKIQWSKSSPGAPRVIFCSVEAGGSTPTGSAGLTVPLHAGPRHPEGRVHSPPRGARMAGHPTSERTDHERVHPIPRLESREPTDSPDENGRGQQGP